MEGMNCKYCGCDWCDGQGKDYVPDICDWFRPMTNADKIRLMDDDELADWFSIYCCRNKTYDAHCTKFSNCKDCWLDWLQEEAKE